MSDENRAVCRELNASEKEAVEGALSWTSQSNAALGAAYLEFEEARTRFELAQKNLASRAATARQSEAQCNQVMAKIIEALELPPGEWSYDGKGSFVRKDK